MHRLLSAALAAVLASGALCDPLPVAGGGSSANSLTPGEVAPGPDGVTAAPGFMIVPETGGAATGSTGLEAAVDDPEVPERRGFPELAVILEDKVSILKEIARIQEELIGFARRDRLAAHALRLPMPICEMVLPAPWCAQLTATFRPDPE